jgi:polyisoprenoid-binding protein YceI
LNVTYKIDPAHSSANFVVRHMMISNVRGALHGVQGTVEYDPQNVASTSIDITIDVSTIDTREPQRDAHLKSAEFLDVEKFPTITFKSKSVTGSGDNLKVTGDLTLHGVTKEVVLDVEGPSPETKDPMGNIRVGASATTKIKRSEFGVTFNMALEAGGVALSDDLKVEIDVSMIKS